MRARCRGGTRQGGRLPAAARPGQREHSSSVHSGSAACSRSEQAAAHTPAASSGRPPQRDAVDHDDLRSASWPQQRPGAMCGAHSACSKSSGQMHLGRSFARKSAAAATPSCALRRKVSGSYWEATWKTRRVVLRWRAKSTAATRNSRWGRPAALSAHEANKCLDLGQGVRQLCRAKPGTGAAGSVRRLPAASQDPSLLDCPWPHSPGGRCRKPGQRGLRRRHAACTLQAGVLGFFSFLGGGTGRGYKATQTPLTPVTNQFEAPHCRLA